MALPPISNLDTSVYQNCIGKALARTKERRRSQLEFTEREGRSQHEALYEECASQRMDEILPTEQREIEYKKWQPQDINDPSNTFRGRSRRSSFEVPSSATSSRFSLDSIRAHSTVFASGLGANISEEAILAAELATTVELTEKLKSGVGNSAGRMQSGRLSDTSWSIHPDHSEGRSSKVSPQEGVLSSSSISNRRSLDVQTNGLKTSFGRSSASLQPTISPKNMLNLQSPKSPSTGSSKDTLHASGGTSIAQVRDMRYKSNSSLTPGTQREFLKSKSGGRPASPMSPATAAEAARAKLLGGGGKVPASDHNKEDDLSQEGILSRLANWGIGRRTSTCKQ